MICNSNIPLSSSALISDEDKKFYQPDNYYVEYTFYGRKVITFEERKEISYSSRRGLYVAEILLLNYCTFGTYPKPKNGYPGFWWFEYGIRDVGRALKSLEQRDFIQMEPLANSLHRMTVSELRELLQFCGFDTKGKKGELVNRLSEYENLSDLAFRIKTRKYIVTALGRKEIDENQYIPYMHRHPRKTDGNCPKGPAFNVWEINRRLGGRIISDWDSVISEAEQDYKNSRLNF